MNKRVLNISLRGITLASRFLFIFFLAKYLAPNDLGLYGIFTATVGYALYFVGLDFYVYTTREIIKSEKSQWGAFLKNQAFVSFLLYIVLFVLLIFTVAGGKISLAQASWFILILILEHVNQEISRLLVAISKQTTASFLLFVRQGLWAILIVILMASKIIPATLNAIFIFWSVSGLLSLILGVCSLKKAKMGGWKSEIDYSWILKGIKVSGLFLIATLALRGLQTVDRYWMQYLNDLEVVGAYVLFIGMASTLMTFLDASVFSFSYPALIKLKNDGDKIAFRKHLKKMSITTVAITIAFVVISVLLMPFLLKWTEKPIFEKYLLVYYILLAATAMNALGMIFHYALYAIGKDKAIIASHIISLLVFFVTVLMLQNNHKITAVPAGITAAFTFILIFKSVVFYYSKKEFKTS